MRPRTSPALLAACASLLASCSGSDSPATMTVTGRLVDHDREPIPLVAVVVGGQAPVLTDVDGRFTVSGVEAPYDATAVFSGWVLTYVGLTRADPTLYWIDFNGGGAGLCRASVRGQLAPYAAATDVMVALDSTPPTQAYQRASRGASSDPWQYTLSPYWYGPETITGSLNALGWTPDATTGLPGSWVGATAEVAVTDGDYASAAPTLALETLPAGTVSGAVSWFPAADLQSVSRTVDVRYPGGTTFHLLWDGAGAPEFSYVVPRFAGATFDVTTSAWGVDGGRVEARALDLVPGAAGQPIAMSAPPSLTSPEDGATGFTASTRLTWTPFAGAVHVVTVWPERYAPMYQIVTAGSSTTLPDLRAYGVSMAPASVHTWYVAGVAPFAAVDDVAGDARVERWEQRGSTQSRKFTTAP